jgi:hypothetical protein
MSPACSYAIPPLFSRGGEVGLSKHSLLQRRTGEGLTVIKRDGATPYNSPLERGGVEAV